jgi:thioredoxin reductase
MSGPVRSAEVLVVGAGPAGLSTAAALAREGVDVEVVDREAVPGGVPRHCHHTGFGLRDLRRVLTGPAYAGRLVDRAIDAGARLRPGVTVTGWAADAPGGVAVETTSPVGHERLEAAVCVLATGARERPRAARWIAGDRAPGVLTTGELQHAVYDERLPVGTAAVVVGAEHVSYSAVLTLRAAGVRVVAMVTDQPRHETYAAFAWPTRLGLRVPLVAGARVERVLGHGRVRAVELRLDDGGRRELACDTVVLTGDWVADHELARLAGAAVVGPARAVVVDESLRTAAPRVLAAGNVVHPVLTADLAAADGPVAARRAVALLRGEAAGPSTATVAVALGEPLAAVFPPRLSGAALPPRGRLVLWPGEAWPRARLEVRQGGRLLHRSPVPRALVRGRPTSVDASWATDLQVPGPEVVVTAHA